ncbi:hypothetical protein NDU88_008070 [Pleurodeles waltl]|uniref:Uncharacterized protein n=1 Tax=Pleurodeles waltl TaxID=8319 RepID=A0AAV7RTK9_PLEWA|nr:hypothetical protein NDU88_008070 [Pleurodeles waltl]
MVHTPREIQARFTRHYEALYAPGAPPMESLCSDFLADVELPCLEEEQMEALEVPLDLEEIRAYLTPARVNRYFAHQDEACSCCSCVGVDFLHMLWSCPPLCCYWKVVVNCLSECTARRVPFTWEACILGLFPRGKWHRAAVRFTDLGLITAKRLVTRRWRSSDPPSVQAWKCSFEVWTGAEGVALKREEVLGLRKFPLSAGWEELMLRLRNMNGDSAVGDSV